MRVDPGVVPRDRHERDYQESVPVHVVWELTLACNLKCSHCGSRAGKRRPDELNTAEALAVVDSLARLGTRELTLIGGEAYLRRDWTEIIARAVGHGLYVGMQTGARALTDQRLQAGIAAGLHGIGVSIDGLERLHDRNRGVKGSFAAGIDALRRARAEGLKTSANTCIGPETIAELPELLDLLVDTGISHWLVAITVAMGNAVEHPELLLQPWQMGELMPLLGELFHRAREAGVVLSVANNVGYFGPYEYLWRSERIEERDHFGGCAAGHNLIGLEADGTVKGCPSLPTVAYAGGNVRDLSLDEIWQKATETGSLRPSNELWGYCADCYYADVCNAGCTWTSHSLLGKPGNNPYCHHRVLSLAAEGRRERIVKIAEAGTASFATGRFELIEEALDGSPLPPKARAAVRIVPRSKRPPLLDFCHGCEQFLRPGEVRCPFCGGDVAALREGHEAARRDLRRLMDEVRALLPTTTATDTLTTNP